MVIESKGIGEFTFANHELINEFLTQTNILVVACLGFVGGLFLFEYGIIVMLDRLRAKPKVHQSLFASFVAVVIATSL